MPKSSATLTPSYHRLMTICGPDWWSIGSSEINCGLSRRSAQAAVLMNERDRCVETYELMSGFALEWSQSLWKRVSMMHMSSTWAEEEDSCSMQFASLSRLVASSLTQSIGHGLGFNSHPSHHHVELHIRPLSNWLHLSRRLMPQMNE